MRESEIFFCAKWKLNRIFADLDMDKIREVRSTQKFFRDRPSDAYGQIVAD